MRWAFAGAIVWTGCGGTASQLETYEVCGGFAGLPCNAGTTCQDDPTDACDPAAGGADCLGHCFDCEAPALEREYLSRDLDCLRLDWSCPPGELYVYDPSCGCACVNADRG